MRLALPQTPRGENWGPNALSFGLVNPGGFAGGGSSGSSSSPARGLFQPMGLGGFEVHCEPNSPCHKTCDAFEACCQKPTPRNSQSPRWQYVGEGRGGYDKVMHLNYVGEGCGNYDESAQHPGQSTKARGICACLLVCSAFLIGVGLALHRCAVDDDQGVWCSSEFEETLERAVSEAKARWGQLSPKEYCSQSGSEPDKRKMDFCCKASRTFCRTYMTAQLNAGFPYAIDQEDRGQQRTPRLPPPPPSVVASETSLTLSPTAPPTHSAKLQPDPLRKLPLLVESTTSATRPPTPPPKLLYDCTDGWSDWMKQWTEPKKDWCCQHALKGCFDGPPVAAPTTTQQTTTVAPTTEAPIFDCAEGAAKWEQGWSVPKKAWCCVQTGQEGCPPTPLSSK